MDASHAQAAPTVQSSSKFEPGLRDGHATLYGQPSRNGDRFGNRHREDLDYSRPFLPHFSRRRADPSPLAFAALGTGLISLVALGTRDIDTLNIVVSIALGYSAFALLVAGIWEFPGGNSFAAALYITLAGLFASITLALSPWSGISAAYADSSDFSTGVSFVFFSYFIVVVLFTFAAIRSSGGLLLDLFLIDLTLLFFGLSFYFPGNTGLLRAAGAFCVLAAFTSWYAFLACLTTHHTSPFRLPVLGDLRPKTVRDTVV
ncbi:uncharacterized protein JCM10292_007185 [Rhodotorula paludigena]|uniref:uncharacterized protein n=1 Tax=Rhodotorula paludigena TaxID=86838 RepID=UPI0031702982